MDPYKSLLASASREHVKRSSALQSPLVGNVFLPAIQSPKRPVPHCSGASPSAMSMQHLKVIEQCIQAENRREAQLAKCQSVRERRFWTRKFQAQREHERELIEALMIPSDKALGLELLDLDADTEVPSVGRLMNTMSDGNHRRPSADKDAGVGGLTSSVTSPDRVFRKATANSTLTTTTAAKPHARKKFTLPECHGSPGKKVSRHHVDAAAETQPPICSPDEDRRRKDPPERKRSPSRSASPVRGGSTASLSPKTKASPPKAQGVSVDKRNMIEHKAIDRDRYARATSKTRVPPLVSVSKPQAPVSSARKINGGRNPQVAAHKQVDVDEIDSVTLFDGARSFAEVQRLALEAEGVTEIKAEEKETQTSSRVEAVDAQHGAHWASRSTGNPNSLLDDQDSRESDGQDDNEQLLPARPHSSPPMRSLSSLGFNRADDEKQRLIESKELAPWMDTSGQASARDEGAVDEQDDEATGDAEVVASEEEGTETQVGREVQQQEERAEAQGDEPDTLFTRTMGESGEKTVEEVDEVLAIEPDEKMDEEDLDGVNDGHAEADGSSTHDEVGEVSLSSRADEEELETDVAEVLFDLVDLVADAVEQQQRLEDRNGRSDASEAADMGTASPTPPARPSTAERARSAALVCRVFHPPSS